MRNLITIDVFGECACACVANIYDASNVILIVFENRSYTAPKIEISYNDTTTVYDLEIVNGFATFTFPFTEIFSTTTECEFRFVDGEKVGRWFTIWNLYGAVVPAKKTLKVARAYEYAFSCGYHAIAPETPVTAYDPDDFEIDEDGELSLKDPEESAAVEKIIATDKGGIITNIRVQYSDKTESSNDCKYDEDTGKLIKFGDLPIDWSFINES